MRDIRSVARRIGKEFRPRQVILFGSYARGEATEDSDVDLLVIMRFEGKAAYKAAEILLKANPVFATEILVRTPQTVRERLAMGDGFIEEILREGKVLYAGDHRRVGGQGRAGLRRRRPRTAAAKSPRL